jgi:hypothetical protein
MVRADAVARPAGNDGIRHGRPARCDRATLGLRRVVLVLRRSAFRLTSMKSGHSSCVGQAAFGSAQLGGRVM